MSMFDNYDIGNLARFRVARHGLAAVHYADRAIAELDELGEPTRAQAWRTLRCLLVAMVTGDPHPARAAMH
jgi:hypothetical protein